MKLRHLLIVVAVVVVTYSGFSVSIAANASADADTCCGDNGGCPDDYRCDYSQPCGTLPGQCVPQPAAERQVTR